MAKIDWRWEVFILVCNRSCCRTNAHPSFLPSSDLPTTTSQLHFDSPQIGSLVPPAYCQHRPWGSQTTWFTTSTSTQSQSSPIQVVTYKLAVRTSFLTEDSMLPELFLKSNRETAWASKLHIKFLSRGWKNVYKYQHLRETIFVSFQGFQVCKIPHSQAQQKGNSTESTAFNTPPVLSVQNKGQKSPPKKLRLDFTSECLPFQPPFELHRSLRELLFCQNLGD